MKEKLDRDIEKLKIEHSDLLHANYKLKNEAKKISDLTEREKANLAKLKLHAKKAMDGIKAINTDNQEILNDLKARASEVSKQEGAIKKSDAYLEGVKKALEKKDEELMKQMAAYHKLAVAVKNKQSELILKAGKLEAERKLLDKKEISILTKKNEVDDGYKELDKQIVIVNENKETSLKHLDDIKKVRLGWEAKLHDIKCERDVINFENKNLSRKEKDVKLAEELLETKEKSLLTDREELNGHKRSLEATIASMISRENELKVKELRVQKLIREKGIKKELKKLEKALKK